MKIYTKTGDDGTTGLFGGSRVAKDDDRVEAFGSVDEANAALGLAQSTTESQDIAEWLKEVQSDLFTLGAELACAPDKQQKLTLPHIEARRIEWLEQTIDHIEARLSPLKNFILPGGSLGSSALHHARTVVRRAERRALHLNRQAPVRTEVLVYLNRLSDFLFVLARYENSLEKTPDIPWRARP